jgi:lipoprotein-anchoring transpeptidase ErfK/SrfK
MFRRRFLLKGSILLAGTAFCIGVAGAAPMPPAPYAGSVYATAAVVADEIPAAETPAHLRRTMVDYATAEAPGTVIVDTANTHLYLVLGNGTAIRYGIGVGREGFTWSGTETVTRKSEWPDWTPPAEMIARQPYLARFMAGGEGNPLGARAMYLGNTVYRIHGTNMPDTIGQNVSSGCIRLLNEDVIDLYSRVNVGAKIIVLPARSTVAVVTRGPASPVVYGVRRAEIY